MRISAVEEDLASRTYLMGYFPLKVGCLFASNAARASLKSSVSFKGKRYRLDNTTCSAKERLSSMPSSITVFTAATAKGPFFEIYNHTCSLQCDDPGENHTSNAKSNAVAFVSFAEPATTRFANPLSSM